MKKNAQLATVKKWRQQRKQGSADEFDVALLDEAARLDGRGSKRPPPNARRQLKVSYIHTIMRVCVQYKSLFFSTIEQKIWIWSDETR
jgi:hypothetical protein